jgi:hypothetical protein
MNTGMTFSHLFFIPADEICHGERVKKLSDVDVVACNSTTRRIGMTHKIDTLQYVSLDYGIYLHLLH